MALKRSRAAYEADLQRQQSPYVFFGTPLPPLDPHTRDDGSYVPVWKQEVVDDRGRKRLHGAFTGGFSAGYFNSVGSKEGWTPASFVSSRANRAKAAQRAEDYMDDEDLADAEEAKQLETKAAYSGFGSTEQELGQKGPFMDLFRPQDETMGLKLLRRMGWRDGQGIGPHVRRRRKKTGAHDPGGDAEEEEYLAAPENTRLISFIRKLDTKGLGYGVATYLAGKKAEIIHELGTKESPATSKKTAKSKRGGIGIGVLNDTGSDEEDPYDMGPRISLPRALNGEKKKKKRQVEDNRTTVHSNPLLKNRPVFISKKVSGFRRCHDGKLPLDGFVLSTQGPISEDRNYSPPTIPEGWKSSLQKSAEGRDTSNYQSTADIAKSSTFDPSSRASLLGETPLPGKSVFDFLTPSARDKLVSASNNPNLPAARSEAPPSEAQSQAASTHSSQIPDLDPQTAATALGRGTSGFVPYTDDPPKLARYRAFLTFRSGLDKNAPEPECPAGTRREDFINELHEFVHSATIFKPMTGAMASRFTSSAGGPSSGPGQTTVSGTKDAATEDRPVLTLGGGRSLPPEEEAAKAGMWGPLTRKTEPFYPTRLLCKRFGVPPPIHVMPDDSGGGGRGGTATGSMGSGGRNAAATTAADMLAGFGSRFTSGGVQVAESEHQQGRRDKLELLGKRDMDELRKASGLPALGEVVKRKDREVVDPNVNEALEAERPSEETFKAIFADD